MSGGFVKIYSGILDSSLFDEDLEVRYLFMILLVMADADGFVRGTGKAIARRARLDYDVAMAALRVLESPDVDDSSGVDDGRRVTSVRGGWQVVNHGTYRAKRTDSQAANAARVRKYRARKALCNGGNVTRNGSNATRNGKCYGHAEAEAEAEAEAKAEAESNTDYPAGAGAGARPASLGIATADPATAKPKPKPRKPPRDKPQRYRMHDGWRPPSGIYPWASMSYDVRLPPEETARIVEVFRDWWVSTPKLTARHDAGWLAALRNWLRRERQSHPELPQSHGLADSVTLWPSTPRGYDWADGRGMAPTEAPTEALSA